MRIAVLTGGGDVPGLNAAIKAVVNRAASEGHEVVGFRRGWGGLVATNPDDQSTVETNLMRLDSLVVRTVDRSGGTFLHTSRTNPGRVATVDLPPFVADVGGDGPHDLTEHVLRVLESQHIDVLIPIGGDDTLSYGLRLHQEGFPVVAIPKTMDNDVYGTDYCIGFSTAVTRGVQAIHSLRTVAGSHERLAVVELFGRRSGESSLITAYLSGVDRAIISEVPFDLDRLAKLLLADQAGNPSRYAMMTISEGAQMVEGDVQLAGEADPYGHRKLGGIGATTAEGLKEITGEGIVYQPLAYLMRSGPPDSLDLMVATNYATMATNLAMQGSRGRMVALDGGSYTHIPLEVTGEGIKRVDVDELYDADAYLPKVRRVLDKPMFLY
ncbi:MAG: 6-phosphofructokinase [Acidimicrobiia bacterium]|nr:MAG: 6-phosphofructokinase [Acidimicrobiia bacterium]